ncbi:MAG: 3-keto-disaccharide hydrolase [Flavobacteriaceae bacterium]
MKLFKSLLFGISVLLSLSSYAQDSGSWEILFDGTNLDSWKGYLTEKPTEEWTIKGNTLVFTPEKDRTHGGSNIITKNTYKNFVLSLEWKISKNGNSGVFWAVVEDPKYPEAYQTGPEIQILDNQGHSDGKILTHQAGSLYDMIQATPGVVKGPGQWNHCELHMDYHSNKAKVVLNGQTVVEFEPSGPQWDEMLAKSKFASWPGFAKSKSGHIGLQDHGDRVSFRNIKIKAL